MSSRPLWSGSILSLRPDAVPGIFPPAQAVTPCSAIASASSAGEARSSSSTLAPTPSGKVTSPPSPKVKPTGGVPAKMSAGPAC